MLPERSNLRLLTLDSENSKRDYLSNSLSSEPKYGVLFIDFINTLISKRVRLSEGSKANYKTVIYNLKLFCETYNAELYTNSIGEEFLDDFITFLEDRDLKKGYIAFTVMIIQGLIVKAHRMGYAVDLSYKEVSFEGEETDSIYLSMNEITRIYYYKDLTKSQQKVRDLFIIGCLTGLRFSDFNNLNGSNFIDNYIEKVTTKTKARVVIPMHDYVKDIIKKYGGDIPNGFTNQYFNRSIKEICKKVGIDDKIVIRYTRGGRLIEDIKEKWQIIGTHTARRSAATNMYLTGRMKTFEIMSITGHTTEESFFRYIKVTREDISKQISSDIYFRK